MPRELTEKEKLLEKNRLLGHGKNLIFKYGIRKMSVDDIVKDAGIAKGSFYNFFSSKDYFVYEMIYQLHEDMFLHFHKIMENILKSNKEDRRKKFIDLFVEYFTSPMINSFMNEHEEINKVLMKFSENQQQRIEDLEKNGYEQLFSILGVVGKDIEIVQNYLHIIIFGLSRKNVLNISCIDETIRMMLDGLLNYLEV